MAYDNKTYGQSPFGNTTATTTHTTSSKAPAQRTEALSDHISEPEETSTPIAPALPADYKSSSQPSRSKVSFFYIPKGRIANLTMLGEALIWLMAWGTVGFFRAHVPAPVIAFFDGLFAPWGMAGLTLVSGLLIGRLFRDYRLKIGLLRESAVLAIEYGEVEHRADAQLKIDRLLTEAAESTKRIGRWLVTWLTALGCLFIIGAFY